MTWKIEGRRVLITGGTPGSSENHRRAKHGLDFDDLQMQNGYSPSKAYAASKLANILFTVELARRLRGSNVTARVLHPGVVTTSSAKGPDGSRWTGTLMTVLKPLLRKPAEGARTSVFLATADNGTLGEPLYCSFAAPREPIPAAIDAEDAARLWSASAVLVDLPG